MAPNPGQTLRLLNMPMDTTEQDIKDFFNARLGNPLDSPNIQRIGQISSEPESDAKNATVTFWTHILANKAKKLHLTLFETSRGSSTIEIDDHFLGLTIIYSSDESLYAKADLTVIAVHGLGGHAYNSFSTRQSVGTVGGRETMWLRDLLPKFLEQRGLYSRVMTYGYRPQDWMENSEGFLTYILNDLRQMFDLKRVSARGAPIFFLAHSLGGFIVKKMVVSLLRGDDSLDVDYPIAGCAFFGTPQNENTATRTQSWLRLVGDVELETPAAQFRRFFHKNGMLIDSVTNDFKDCCGKHSLRTIACYETRATNGLLLVDKLSAVQRSPIYETHIPVNSSHEDLVRFESNIDSDSIRVLRAITEIALAARISMAGVRPSVTFSHPMSHSSSTSTSSYHLASGQRVASAMTGATSPAESFDDFYLDEDHYAYLARYQTVFLVDDSGSMYGERWYHAKEILANMASIVSRYDADGFDVNFLNHGQHDLTNVTKPEVVLQLFGDIEPDGSTPTAAILERELSRYIARYRNDRSLRGLNLVVVTDGVPDDEFEVSEVIVQARKEMDRLKAKTQQIGIQFVQIGDDEALSKFLRHLDDDLSRFDDHLYIDTISYEPDNSGSLLEKVLFGGIRKAYDSKAYEYGKRLTSDNAIKVFQSEMLLARNESRSKPEPSSVREVLLQSIANSEELNPNGEYLVSYECTWELLTFIRNQLEPGQRLSQAVALTGSEENAQAVACAEYVLHFWPETGPLLLAHVEKCLHGYLGSPSVQPSGIFTSQQLSHLEVSFDGDIARNGTAAIKTTVMVQAVLQVQAEVAEVLAWLTAAFRSGHNIKLSRSEAELKVQKRSSNRTKTHFTLQAEALKPLHDGTNMCWYPLFPNGVIAVQFPFAHRTHGVGVELSPLLMATLAGVITAVEVRGGLILRGLSTALIPLEEVEDDAIQWHLVTFDLAEGECNTDLFGGITDGGSDLEYYKVQDVQTLLRKKAYLGWCEVATVLLGTKQAEYRKVTWSDQSETHRTIELTGFSLGLASAGLGMVGPSITGNFAIPKQNATQFMDIKQNLEYRLRFSIIKPILVYDTLDRRGWMVPTTCLLLHMMHLRLRELSDPLDTVGDDSASMPYSKISGEGGRQAYDILIEYMGQEATSALGSSKVWEATLAQLYIALDTFLQETCSLRGSSSYAQKSEICGFELMDAVRAENPFRYNQRRIGKESGGWAQIADSVGHVLFCRGLGDAIVPGVGANALCTNWSNLPRNSDYLAAYIPCIMDLLRRQGKHEGNERLSERIKKNLFQSCDHKETSRCFHLQTYSEIADPPSQSERGTKQKSDSKPIPREQTPLEERGAIVFGKTTRLPKELPIRHQLGEAQQSQSRTGKLSLSKLLSFEGWSTALP